MNKTDFIGESLGGTVQQGLSGLKPLEQPKLCVRTTRVPLSLQVIQAEDVTKSLAFVQQARSGKEVEFYTLVTAYKTLLLDQLQNSPPLAPSSEAMTWGLSRTWAGVGGNCRLTCR